jgi:flagellar motor protein MotB
MNDPRPIYSTTTIDTEINFWPSLIDMMTSVVMVFLLINFLQTTLNLEDLEAVIIRSNQLKFQKIFEAEFAKEMEQGTVSIKEDLNLLEITFSDQILFELGKYELQYTGKRVLRRCAQIFLKANESSYKQIQIEGHTDHIPIKRSTYPADNWELSTARAISVVRLFLEESHLPKELFSANGYADNKPVVPSDSEVGEPRNRRIEIRVLFSIPEQKLGL